MKNKKREKIKIRRENINKEYNKEGDDRERRNR